MPANECIPYYEPGSRITALTTEAISGKRFVKVSADKLVGSAALSTTADGGNIKVSMADAGETPIGVSSYDAASGALVGVLGVGHVVPIKAGEAIAAGDLLVAGADGVAMKQSAIALTGNAQNITPVRVCAVALADAALNADVIAKLV